MKYRGTEIVSPHGIPLDLLDRLLIIRTLPYSLQEIVQILSIRANIESIPINEAALIYLAQVGSKSSLRLIFAENYISFTDSFFKKKKTNRYAIQLLTPAHILAKTRGKEFITKEDIEEVSKLFFDSKTSARILREQSAKYMQ